jgi:hypothetical protein
MSILTDRFFRLFPFFPGEAWVGSRNDDGMRLSRQSLFCFHKGSHSHNLIKSVVQIFQVS